MGESQFSRQSDRRQSAMIFFFLTVPRGVGLHHLQVFILMSFTHFLELRDAERLYVSTRDLADATRGKTVVIAASRVLYACIFVYRVLRVMTHPEMCSREVSDST